MRKRTEYEAEEKRMLNRSELCAYTGLGTTSAIQFARENGAEKRYGKRVLFDKIIIDKALDALQEV